MLEDKIYKYLKQGTFADLKVVAKDISEICEKENSNPIDHEYCQMWLDYNKEKLNKLETENTDLKNKLFDYNPTKQIELEQENIKLKSKIDRLEKNEIIYEKRLRDINND